MNPLTRNPSAYRSALVALAIDSLKWGGNTGPGPTSGEIIRKALGLKIATKGGR